MKAIILIVALAIAAPGFSQLNQRKSPHDTVTSVNASVTYGRPYKKGRELFGALEQYGKVWRVGADEATTITFNKNVKIGQQEVPAGTYTLFAIPTESEWGIILNSVPGQWGAYSYEKNKDKNVARFTVPVTKLDKEIEQLTIRFADDQSMIIEWDKTQVRVPFTY